MRVGLDEPLAGLHVFAHEFGKRRVGYPRIFHRNLQETAARRLTARHRGGMVDAVAREVVRLVADGDADPGNIAIIAPHADGVLRFLIGEALRSAQIPCAIIRRFESLREEPEVRVALALAALAHPDWQRCPHLSDVTEALGTALGVDPARARLLARAGYDSGGGRLRPLGDDATLAERATPAALHSYESLRMWLEARRADEILPLDLFFRRLFGEVLSGACTALAYIAKVSDEYRRLWRVADAGVRS